MVAEKKVSEPVTPPPLMVPSSPNTPALRLTDRTPTGWRIFNVKFRARLGAPLRATLDHAISTSAVHTTEPRRIALYAHISDTLVSALDGHDDLLDRMINLGLIGNGPAMIMWIQNELAGGSVARDLATLTGIISAKIGADVVSDVRDIQRLVAQLSITLPDEFIAAIVLIKLPVNFAHTRDTAIEADTLPSVESVIAKLQQRVAFLQAEPPATALVMQGNPSMRYVCPNCNGAHRGRDCRAPKSDCDWCGKKAGHLTEHCFITNDKALPSMFSPEHKTAIEAQRVKYKNGTLSKASEKQGAAQSLFAYASPSPSAMADAEGAFLQGFERT
jgi:hypothetical protein